MVDTNTNYLARSDGTSRRLATCLALLVLLLLIAPASFAQLQPTYMACTATPMKPQPPVECSGIWQIRHAPGAALETFIGYVEQTQVAGTVPAYLTCKAVRPTPRSQPECDGKWFISPAPYSQYDSFIGYVYTTQIAQSAPRYIACVLAYTPPRAPIACANRWFATPDANKPFASFVGYVYVDPPLWRYGLSPKYYVSSVIYVPPGQGPSTITYGAGTVTGTTLSTEESWNVEANFTFGLGQSGNNSISFGNAFGGATTRSTDMQMSSSASRTYRGQTSNTINHDYDQVILYLGVKLNAVVDYTGKVNWDVDFSQVANQGFATSGYPISIGCLRPGSTVPAGVCDATLNFLAANGITAADFPEMLKVHPFAYPGAPASPDPDRYKLVDAVNFLPDPTTSTYTYMLNNNSMTTNARKKSVSFTVTAGGTVGILKNSNKLTFTQSSTDSNRTGTNSTSTFTVSLPSAPYSGPSTLFVYIDTIYKTFMFSFSQ
jgi:hypothetical protein